MIRFIHFIGMIGLWLTLSVGPVWGCSGGGDVASVHGIETQVTDPQSGVTIRTRIDRDEIAASDRLTVVVLLEWTSPATATLIEPDWAQSGWTLIEFHKEPAKLTDSGFLVQSSALIEPFLPGEYAVPVFEAEVYQSENAQPYRMQSLPIPVRVRSVLDEQDAGELDPADGLLDPAALETSRSASNGLLLGFALGVAGIAIVIIWLLSRSSGDGTESPSVYAQLERVAHGRDASDEDAYNTLYRVFTRLDDRLQQTTEIRSMIEQCERARFSAGDADTLDPRAMARHTLELLGASPSDASNMTRGAA